MTDARYSWGIVAEGCVDRFLGRPRSECPYSRQYAALQVEEWRFGWDHADWLLSVRTDEEVGRWLRDAA